MSDRFRKNDFLCDLCNADHLSAYTFHIRSPADASDAISLDGDANLKVIKDADDADLDATAKITSAQLGDMIVIVSTISTAGLGTYSRLERSTLLN